MAKTNTWTNWYVKLDITSFPHKSLLNSGSHYKIYLSEFYRTVHPFGHEWGSEQQSYPLWCKFHNGERCRRVCRSNPQHLWWLQILQTSQWYVSISNNTRSTHPSKYFANAHCLIQAPSFTGTAKLWWLAIAKLALAYLAARSDPNQAIRMFSFGGNYSLKPQN